ncbi:hypothetical protein A1O7_06221 [Cladophialophora yegresii CBS 114405]|uniref:Uncharacterized protein n=1 Tax=Cladophialophora yegresii CBS 114405 TaxID=1182544 RepID=W9W2N8_9EURO|nr:uncharacterized protein A1O7_06221 [Cladophialophora yegresii CBS 114405]EXJ58791.1 hypothetical protein A1O7_06221 [Cladophialophora yegresii CBS 114405]
MAAPPQTTCTNLSGKFALNKSLSDDVDAMLELQGINWAIRKVISLASVVLTVKEYTKDATTHIDVTTVVAGLDKTQEDRVLNWQDAEHVDKIFGKCRHRARLVKISEYHLEGPGSAEDAAFLRGEKLKDGRTDSRFEVDEVVQSWVESTGGGAGWKCEQVWGFEVINGERRYTRRVVVWNAGKVVRTRIVYDYKGEGKRG